MQHKPQAVHAAPRFPAFTALPLTYPHALAAGGFRRQARLGRRLHLGGRGGGGLGRCCRCRRRLLLSRLLVLLKVVAHVWWRGGWEWVQGQWVRGQEGQEGCPS